MDYGANCLVTATFVQTPIWPRNSNANPNPNLNL
jgi:hypothetical protein